MLASRIKLKLYLEGEEAPIISASVSSSIGVAATSNIVVPAVDAILKLKARTTVHLFILEQSIADKTTEGEYKLLFAGELMGITYVKATAGRQATLTCGDFSVNWDLAFQYYVGVLGLNRTQRFVGSSSGKTLFNRIFKKHQSVLNRLLRRGAEHGPSTPSLSHIRGLTGGVIHVLEAVGGIDGTTAGINDFFTIEESRIKLVNQLGSDSGKTAIKIFSNKLWWDWLKSSIEQGGQLASFRDLIGMLSRVINYAMMPNTSPFYIRGKKSGDIALAANTLISSLDATKMAAKAAITAMTDKTTYTTLVHSTEATIAILTKPKYQAMFGFASDIISGLTGAKKNITSALATASPGFTGMANDARLIITECEAAADKISKKEEEPDDGGRLIMQVYAPDLWFAVPPSSNILFLTDNSQVVYSRQFMREITRYSLTSSRKLTGSNKLLDSHYYAPWDKDKNVISMGRKIMDHEMFSGIVPKMEHVTSLEFYGGGSKSGESTQANGNDMSYQNFLTHSNFFNYRFRVKTVRVTSPKIDIMSVVGAPIVVMLEEPNAKGIPLQLVGKLQRKVISVTKNGGNTTYDISHARAHRHTDDDYTAITFSKTVGKKVKKNRHYTISAKTIARILANADIPTRIYKNKDTTKILYGALACITAHFKGVVAKNQKISSKSSTVSCKGPWGKIISAKVLPSSMTKGGNLRLTTLPREATGLNGADEVKSYNGEVLHEVRVTERYTTTEYIASSESETFEENMQTSKVGEEYTPKNIGDKFYKLNYGCGSLVEKAYKYIDETSEEYKVHHYSDTSYTLQTAIDALYVAYRDASKNNPGLSEEISRDQLSREIRHRQIATEEDVMENFHKNAVSGESNLMNLKIAGVALASLDSKKSKSTVDPTKDPRPERKAAVKAYIESLNLLAKIENTE